MQTNQFISQFAFPEFYSVAGKKLINLLVLIFILTIALLALGIGNSTIDYLRLKMDNPFVKFITVTNEYNNSKYLDLPALNASNLKSQFNYGEVTPIYYGYADFKKLNGKLENATYRKVTTNEEFYKFISNSDNGILQSENTFKDNSYGVIVTRKYLQKLGFSEDSIPAAISFNLSNQLISIPVCAVVTQLPDLTDILISDRFYSAFKDYDAINIETPEHNQYLKVFIPNLSEISPKDQQLGFYQIKNECCAFGLTILKNGCTDATNDFQQLILRYPNSIRFYNFDKIPNDNPSKGTVDRISFSFYNLDSVRPFQDYLLDNHKLAVDMDTIEAKENFRFFEKLSNLLSGSLIAFIILSIVIFITNLIFAHIERNKKNLGTLKAFGLSNRYIILIYTGISVSLIAIAFLISYVISVLIGDIVLNTVLTIFKINTVTDAIDFHSYNLVYLLSFFLIIPCAVIYYRLWSSLKYKTPGDLVYERN